MELAWRSGSGIMDCHATARDWIMRRTHQTCHDAMTMGLSS